MVYVVIAHTTNLLIFRNIRRKNRRDIDGILGLSALRFKDIALCAAEQLEISEVECRHSTLLLLFYIGWG